MNKGINDAESDWIKEWEKINRNLMETDAEWRVIEIERERDVRLFECYRKCRNYRSMLHRLYALFLFIKTLFIGVVNSLFDQMSFVTSFNILCRIKSNFPSRFQFTLSFCFSEKFKNKITWVRYWFGIIHNWCTEFVARTIRHTCSSIAYREILFSLEFIKEKRIKSSAQ